MVPLQPFSRTRVLVAVSPPAHWLSAGNAGNTYWWDWKQLWWFNYAWFCNYLQKNKRVYQHTHAHTSTITNVPMWRNNTALGITYLFRPSQRIHWWLALPIPEAKVSSMISDGLFFKNTCMYVCMYVFERQTESDKEGASVCWFTAQMPTMACAGPKPGTRNSI